MRHWIKTLLIGTLVAAPLGALAAIDGTHHDMTNIISTSEKCSYCHSITDVTAAAADITAYGEVGNFCIVVCHTNSGAIYTSNNEVYPRGPQSFLGDFEDGTGAFASDVTVNATPPAGASNVLTGTHGYLKSAIPAPDAAADIVATGWPHTDETSIQCTSCHAVHDGTNPPFLNGPLSTGTAGSAFCARCHTGSANSGVDQAGRYGNGTHPTEIAYSLGTSGIQMQSTPLPAGPMLAVASGTGDMTVDGDSWVTGGHLMDTDSTMPVADADGILGCYSCHSAHSGVNSDLMMLSAGALEDMCYSCHGGGPATDAGNTQENPGTTSFYHPVNTEAPTSPLVMALTTTNGYTAIPASYRPAGANDSPWCVSCHDVHGGKGEATSQALRDVNGTGLTVDICGECHAAIGGHHISNTGTDYGVTTGTYTYPDSAPWGADLTDGLQCSDCHGGTTAHNW